MDEEEKEGPATTPDGRYLSNNRTVKYCIFVYICKMLIREAKICLGTYIATVLLLTLSQTLFTVPESWKMSVLIGPVLYYVLLNMILKLFLKREEFEVSPSIPILDMRLIIQPILPDCCSICLSSAGIYFRRLSCLDRGMARQVLWHLHNAPESVPLLRVHGHCRVQPQDPVH